MQRRAFLRNARTFALSACAGSFRGFRTPAASPLRRFKLGVISDEFSQDFEEALKTMKQFGLEWVEIRTVWPNQSVNLRVDSDSVKDIRVVKGGVQFTR